MVRTGCLFCLATTKGCKRPVGVPGRHLVSVLGGFEDKASSSHGRDMFLCKL